MSNGIKILLAVLFGVFSLAAQFVTAYFASYGLWESGLGGWLWLLWVPMFLVHGMAFQTNRDWIFKKIFA